MFIDAKTAQDFIFGGNATVTLRSVKTGVHFTYKVSAPKVNPSDIRFVSVLCGPDDYRYVGILRNQSEFSTTSKSCPQKDAKSAAAFRYCIENLARGEIPEALEIRHEGRCGCCGRKITTPTSLDTGIGPECGERKGIPMARLARVITQTTTRRRVEIYGDSNRIGHSGFLAAYASASPEVREKVLGDLWQSI
jgi:Family of unknown function (DUF6011)